MIIIIIITTTGAVYLIEKRIVRHETHENIALGWHFSAQWKNVGKTP